MADNTETPQLDPATKLPRADEIARDRLGQFAPGQSGNPAGTGGFGDHPENRSNGSWKKEDTARFKLEQMMQLNDTELQEIIDNPNKPRFERTLATSMMNGQWTVVKEMMQEVYGRKTDIDMNLRSEDGVPIIKGFVIPMAPKDFIGDDGRQQQQ